MTLVDRNNETLTVISQTKLDKTDTVYNFTVDEFHTYHIGELGVWMHNANCLPNFSGMSATTRNRIQSLANTATNTTTGRSVLNFTQSKSRNMIGDFHLLTVGSKKTIVDRAGLKIKQLSDDYKVIYRLKSKSGEPTIEVQRPNGNI